MVFKENGTLIMVDASKLAYKNVELNFDEDMPYFIQLVNKDGNPVEEALTIVGVSDDSYADVEIKKLNFINNIGMQKFNIKEYPGEKGNFIIWNSEMKGYLESYKHASYNGIHYNNDMLSYPYGINDGNNLESSYKFKIERLSNGLCIIKSFDKDSNTWLSLRRKGTLFTVYSSEEEIYFRFVAADANWKVEEIATKHLQPILPAVETSFAFNNTLVNCGKGDLEQEVGIEKSITTKNTSGYNENIGISSSKTTSVGLKVGAKTQVGFFAAKVDISAEISTSLELTTKATQSKEFSESVTNKYFAKRTVNIPPKSASLVSDAYQTYSKVELPFVQTLRLRADHVNPNTNAVIGAMTGKEIVTQLVFSNFSGYVIAVGDYYADITLRGKTTLDNLVDTKSEVKDVAPNCE